MALTVTSTKIVSDRTRHHAVCLDPVADRWCVSWLPQRSLPRDHATSALVISETARMATIQRGAAATGLVDSLAAELQLTGPDALILTSECPQPQGCPCSEPATNPTTRPLEPRSKPFSKYTHADWRVFHRWASFVLSTHAERATTHAVVPPATVTLWRASAASHRQLARAATRRG